MPVDTAGRWSPPLFPKQAKAMEIARSGNSRLLLLSGPRLSGKTIGALDIIVDHAWNTDPANVCIVSITQSAGYDSGVWTDLVETTLPNWIEDGAFGMEWIKKPAIQHVSKKPYCVVSNSAGNPVRFQLESLKNEKEVEQRFKSKRYSCMFINELSNFRHMKTLLTWTECLRMIGLPPERHLLLCDTNPSDEGQGSWIWKLWYKLPSMDLENDQTLDYTDEEKESLAMLKPLLGLVEFELDDNIFCPAERINQLKATLASNRDLYDRYVRGLWVTASMDAIFGSVFKESRHVIGDAYVPTEENPSIMTVEESCFELYTGWDLGVVNSAACIVEKAIPPGDNNKLPCFKVLDELVIVGQDFSMDDFVLEFVEKMRYWEEVVGKPVRWTHYSDRSAFDMKEPTSNRFHHQIVWDACPDDTPGGKIRLIAAHRGQHSVQQRIDLMRKLLWEERIFFSNNKAPDSISMLKSIKKGTSYLSPIEKGSPHKHIFDAIMYCVASECYDEIAQSIMRTMKEKRRKGANAGFRSIRI